MTDWNGMFIPFLVGLIHNKLTIEINIEKRFFLLNCGRTCRCYIR